MNKDIVVKLISNLKNTSDKAYIHKQLLKIRTIVRDAAGVDLYSQSNGIQPLLILLQKPNEPILDTVLSILGNCCMNKEICQQVIKTAGIVTTIISIITSFANTGIQCRACRLLGNLAQHAQKFLTKSQEITAAYGLNSVLNDAENAALVIMAVRTIRLLWQTELKFRTEIIDHGVVTKIMQILIEKMLIIENVKRRVKKEPGRSNSQEEDLFVIRKKDVPDRWVNKEKFKKLLRIMEDTDSDPYRYLIVLQKPEEEDRFLIPTTPENIELFTGLLKCLQMITTVVTSAVAQQIHVNGLGYPALIYLCSADSRYRFAALKVLSNLASNPSARSVLSSENVVVKATDLIGNEAIQLNVAETRYCVNIICLLSSDSCNRSKVRISGGLKKLLNIIRESNCDRVLGMILFGLYQFRFDDLSLDVLINEGIVRTLIKKLSEKMEFEKVDHISKAEYLKIEKEKVTMTKQKKRNRRSKLESKYKQTKKAKYSDPSSPSSSGSSSYNSNAGYYTVNNPSYRCYSPTESLSPCSSVYKDDCDAENYSPVCTDNEDNDDNTESVKAQAMADLKAKEKEVEDRNFDILKFLKEETINDDDNEDVEDDNDITKEPDDCTKLALEVEEEILSLSEKKCIDSMLYLLWIVTIHSTYTADLILKETLDTLLKICKAVSKPFGKVDKILENTIGCHKNFNTLIKTDFVFKIYDLTNPCTYLPDCFTCRDMIKVGHRLFHLMAEIGETGYGMGELAHALLAGKLAEKRQSAIIATFIIKKPVKLSHLLLHCQGLSIIFDYIFQKEDYVDEDDLKLCCHACDGLTMMSINLRIRVDDPKHKDLLIEFSNNFQEEYEQIYKRSGSAKKAPTDIVTFFVKDAKELKFDKEILIELSDVFKSMLTGQFLESKNNEVQFNDVHEDALRYFFYIMLYVDHNKELVQDWKNGEKVPLNIASPSDDNMMHALSAFELSLKYIVTEVELVLLVIVKQLFTSKSVLGVFEWSLDHCNEGLLEASIHYCLTARITGKEKYELFRAALNHKYYKQWKEMITDTLLSKIQLE